MRKIMMILLLCISGVTAKSHTTSAVKQMDRVNEAHSVRVIGGHEVPAGERTFQVALLKGGQAICGGSIIADQWVMTAAHCVDRTGITEILSNTQNLRRGGKRHKIVQMIKHPKYNRYDISKGNDIALIRIKGHFDSDLERLKLANKSISDQAKKGEVSGWGNTRVPSSRPSNQLLAATQTIISDSKCERLQEGRFNKKSIVCAYDASISSCNGDSGGPFTRDLNGETYSIGIVSYGPQTCSGYSAYTETVNFTKWVNQYITTQEEEPDEDEDISENTCPTGYKHLIGVIGSDGFSVVGNKAYHANKGIHTYKSNNSHFRLGLYKYVRKFFWYYGWKRVKSAVSDLSYRGGSGHYALTIQGSAGSKYDICANIP